MSALDGIRLRAEAATNLGEWETTRANDVVIYAPNGFGAYRLIAHADAAADAEFTAHARTDVPRLLGALDAVLAIAERHGVKQWTEEIFAAVNDALEAGK